MTIGHKLTGADPFDVFGGANGAVGIVSFEIGVDQMVGDHRGFLGRGAARLEHSRQEAAKHAMIDGANGRHGAGFQAARACHRAYGSSRIVTPPSPARMPGKVGMKRSPCPMAFASRYVWLTAWATNAGAPIASASRQ